MGSTLVSVIVVAIITGNFQCYSIGWSYKHFAYTSGAYSQPPPPLRMATIYGDHMVLQQAPAMANIWGYVTECDSTLTATFNGMKYTPKNFTGENTDHMDSHSCVCAVAEILQLQSYQYLNNAQKCLN